MYCILNKKSPTIVIPHCTINFHKNKYVVTLLLQPMEDLNLSARETYLTMKKSPQRHFDHPILHIYNPRVFYDFASRCGGDEEALAISCALILNVSAEAIDGDTWDCPAASGLLLLDRSSCGTRTFMGCTALLAKTYWEIKDWKAGPLTGGFADQGKAKDVPNNEGNWKPGQKRSIPPMWGRPRWGCIAKSGIPEKKHSYKLNSQN